MIRILDQWSGKFEVNGEIYNDLYDFEYEDGEEFHIKLLSKRRELYEEESSTMHSVVGSSRHFYRY